MSVPTSGLSLDLASLRVAYAAGAVAPVDVIDEVYARIAERGEDGVWITVVPRAEARAAALALAARPGARDLPLYGVPFAVKDNIDVAGLPTTLAFPPAATTPDVSAPIVSQLIAAGALLIGKTNLDQFATGLNGTRSPYGTPRNPLDPALIPGGSSSGSAVAVAAGLVSFALGTDTAGSGRVPAALTNIVGVKPAPGTASTEGIVPACGSIDCPSVFALTVADGAAVLARLADGIADAGTAPAALTGMRLGVPAAADLDFHGDADMEKAWTDILARLQGAGARLVPLPMAGFYAAGDLLYGGAWVAERHAAIAERAGDSWALVDPAVRQSVAGAAQVSAAQVFADQARLAALRSEAAERLDGLDALMTPTAPTTFTIAEMHADPIARNSILGRLTTFANLLGLAAVAVPAGFAADGRPFGITLSAFGDMRRLLSVGAAAEGLTEGPLGATRATRADSHAQHPAAEAEPPRPARWRSAVRPTAGSGPPGADAIVSLAVVGAHLSGMPLNRDLVRLGATLAETTTTAAAYRLHALPRTSPPKPGLRRLGQQDEEPGATIEVEVYRLTAAALGVLLTTVPAPLAIGSVELADGRVVAGFVCEPHALRDAPDISAFGGWRAYTASLA